MQTVHEPVLLNEVIEGLTAIPKAPDFPWYLDGTLGGGGHAAALIKAMKGELNVIGLDRDPEAVSRAKETLESAKGKIILEIGSFRNIDQVLDRYGIAEVDMVLLDLGISSDELENSGRGFSFQRDEPLVMTLGDPVSYPFTAKDIVNGWDEAVLADVIFGYGEERFARRIARAIVAYRAKKKIETTAELAEIASQAIPAMLRRKMKIHPATKTFQALRIAVNDELNALRDGLGKCYGKLRKGGRMAVISFHSLEDRIVKNFYKERGTEGARIITKKPITASDQELSENPRSRSAKLRIIEKIQHDKNNSRNI